MNDYQRPSLQKTAASRAVRSALGGNDIASESEVQRELRMICNEIQEISGAHNVLRDRISTGCVGSSPTGLGRAEPGEPSASAHSPLGQHLAEIRRQLHVLHLEIRDTTDSVAL